MHLPHSLLFAVVVSHAEFVVSAASSFSLYAYGNADVSGLKLFYADGLAYVGNSAPSFATEATNVTLTLTSDSRFVASPVGSSNWTTNPSMYIGADEGDIKSIGFVSNYQNVSDSVVVTDFGLFGGYAYNDAASAYGMYFVTAPTNESGIYQVKWSASQSKTSESIVPISLRTVAPAIPSE